jgi:hypothetical protein
MDSNSSKIPAPGIPSNQILLFQEEMSARIGGCSPIADYTEVREADLSCSVSYERLEEGVA